MHARIRSIDEKNFKEGESLSKETRLQSLKNFLSNAQYSTIKELANVFDVSEMTIRRDLKLLKDEGVIDIYNGVVILKEVENYKMRRIKNVREKEKLSELALPYVQGRNFIYIDGCTTNLIFSQKLVKMNLNNKITVITNDPRITIELSSNPQISVFMLPGFYDSDGGVLIYHDINDIERYIGGVEIAFIGITAISREGDFSNANPFEVALKRKMVEMAKEVIFLADHTKFGKEFPWRVATMKEVHVVVTDRKPDEIFLKLAKKYDTTIIFPRGTL